jgi:hypothetical protein
MTPIQQDKFLYLGNVAYVPSQFLIDISEASLEYINSVYRSNVYQPSSCPIKHYGNVCKDFKTYGRKACKKCESAYLYVDMISRTDGYVTFPRGDLKKLYDVFSDFKIIDIRKDVPLSSDEKMTFLYDKLDDQDKLIKQIKAANDWLSYGYGIVKAPARSGKTVISALIGSLINQRTCIIVPRKELMKQFFNTYTKFTSLTEDDVCICPDVSKVDNYAVSIFNYQKIMSNKKLSALSGKYGYVVVDECHRAAAAKFSSVVSSLNPKYLLGLTATPDRKDNLHFVSDLVVGPVVVEALDEAMDVNVEIVNTGLRFEDAHRWSTVISRILKHEKRNQFIADYINYDISRGYKILFPVPIKKELMNSMSYIEIIIKLVTDINPNIRCEWMTGDTLPKHRDELLERVNNNEVDLFLATEQLVTEGLDIPPISCIYYSYPMANQPNYYQRTSRIRTYLKDKQEPLVRLFKDEVSASKAFIATVNHINKRYGFNIREV